MPFVFCSFVRLALVSISLRFRRLNTNGMFSSDSLSVYLINNGAKSRKSRHGDARWFSLSTTFWVLFLAHDGENFI